VTGENVGLGRPVRIRGFLEGIEIPIISAQISSQPNAPSQCVIQVPPAELGTRLFPRTLLHLFFFDSLEDAGKLVTYRGSDSTTQKPQSPTLYEYAKDRSEKGLDPLETFDQDERNHRYKLLFSGELIGFQWNKQPTNRSLVLQFLDLSNYWDYAYQFNNTDIFGPGIKAVFSGGGTNLFTDFLSSPGEIATGLLHLPSANYPALKGLMGGMIRLVESIGGCFVQDTKFAGQNVFFSVAELRLHISRMITAYPEDNTVKRLLGGGGYDSLFGRSLGNLGEQVSIRTVLNAIAAMIFHETYNITSPLYVPSGSIDPGARVPRRLKNLPEYSYIYLVGLRGYDLTQELIRTLETEPPEADRRNALKTRDFQTRRLRVFNNSISQTLQRMRGDKLFGVGQNKRVAATLEQVRRIFTQVATLINRRWLPGMPAGRQRDEMVVELNKAAVLLRNLQNLELDISNRGTRTPSRLNSHIVRPDVWFSPPPRCNVLLPHHIFSQSYSRSFMQEPTRLLLKTHDEFYGEDELFDNHFFAPQARTTKGKRHKGTMTELFSRDIMTHELFTGILPIFTKMGEFNIFALRGLEENLKKEKPKVSLAQRSANFLYFKQRFASRQMSVDCVFNPWLVVGFPGLVMDRYITPENAEEFQAQQLSQSREELPVQRLLGTHFLGMFAQIQHSLSFSEAQTSVQIQYPREYDEQTEFFGPEIKEDQVIVKRFGNDALRTHVVAALQKPVIGGIGVYYGVIEEVTEITDVTEGMYFSVYTGPRRIGDPALDGTAVVGVPVRLGDASPRLAREKGANTVVTFKAYRVKEAIPRYRREKVDLPAEELIRPGWYDNVWHPKNVSQVYQHYFRTDAITGKTQIGDPGDQSVGNPRQLARDELARQATGKMQGDQREGIAPAVLTLDDDSSVEQAVRFLLQTYAYISQGNLSAQRFTDAYTWRPIASLPDIFGTADLELDVRGIDVVEGVEGFHSRAFGPYDDLFGLVTPEITEVLGAKKTDQARREGDVRGRKHRAVFDYVDAVRQTVRAKVGG